MMHSNLMARICVHSPSMNGESAWNSGTLEGLRITPICLRWFFRQTKLI